MKKTEINQFTFFRSYYKALKNLPPEEIGEIVMIMGAFFFEDQEIPEDEGIKGSILELIRPILNKSKIKALAGQKGGKSKNIANDKQSESTFHAEAEQTNSETQPIKDKDREKDNDEDNEKDREKDGENNNLPVFTPPTLKEVKNYCWKIDAGIDLVDPEEFFDYYSANGWESNGRPIRDWKAVVRSWQRRARKKEEEAADEEC